MNGKELNCAEGQDQRLEYTGEFLMGLDMIKFYWQHKFGLTCSLISLDLAAIVHLLAVYIVMATTSSLLCLVFPGLEDARTR